MCSLKDSRNLFMQSLLLYTSGFISMPSNVHIVDIENPQGICSATFVVDDFYEIFLHLSTFLIKDLRSA